MRDDRLGGGTRRDNIVLTIIGLIAAPIVGGALGMPIFLTGLQLTGDLSSLPANPGLVSWVANFLGLMIGGSMVGAVFGLAPAFLLGSPLHIFLVRSQHTGRIHYAALGGLIGVVAPFAMSFQVNPLGAGLPLLMQFLSLALLSGVLGGLTFWFIRRPDRDAVNAQPQP